MEESTGEDWADKSFSYLCFGEALHQRNLLRLKITPKVLFAVVPL